MGRESGIRARQHLHFSGKNEGFKPRQYSSCSAMQEHRARGQSLEELDKPREGPDEHTALPSASKSSSHFLHKLIIHTHAHTHTPYTSTHPHTYSHTLTYTHCKAGNLPFGNERTSQNWCLLASLPQAAAQRTQRHPGLCVDGNQDTQSKSRGLQYPMSVKGDKKEASNRTERPFICGSQEGDTRRLRERRAEQWQRQGWVYTGLLEDTAHRGRCRWDLCLCLREEVVVWIPV